MDPFDPRAADRHCRCGHGLAFCHRVNAAKWCGSSSLADFTDDELQSEMEQRAAYRNLMGVEA